MSHLRQTTIASGTSMEPADLLSTRSFSGACDAGFDLYRRQFGALWLSAALIILPIQLLLTLASDLIVSPIVGQLKTPGVTLDTGATFSLICGGVLFGAPRSGVPGILALITALLVSAPNSLLITNAILGRTGSVWGALVQAAPHIGRLLAAWIVACLAVLAACSIGAGTVVIAVALLQVLMGELFGPSGAVASIWIGLVGVYAVCMGLMARFFLFTTQLIVIEGRSVTDVWDRNRQLVSNRRFRPAWFTAALLPIIVLGLQAVLMTSTRVTLASLSVSAAVEAPCLQLADAMFAVFLIPYPVAVTTLLYFGCRSQREGIAVRAAIDRDRGLFQALRLPLTVLFIASLLCCRPAMSQTGPAVNEPDRIHARVREILAAPEFQHKDTAGRYVSAAVERMGKVGDAIQSGWKGFWSAVRRLFHVRTSALQSVVRPVVYALIGIVCLIGLGMLARVVSTVPKWRRTRATRRAAEPALLASRDVDRSPDAWIRQAEILAAQHDFRSASRAILIAQLMWLDRQGAIEWRPDRTNGDYLHAMKGIENSPVYDVVSTSIHEVDPRWFGRLPTSSTDYAGLMAAYRRLSKVVDSAPVHPGAHVSGACHSSGAR